MVRVHLEESLRVPGTDHVDPDAWDPLVMKFCDLFGDARSVRTSRLAEAWEIPGRRLDPLDSSEPARDSAA